MKLRFLFFGAAASAVGSHEHTIELPEGEKVSVVLNRLSREFPRLGNHKLIVAVNEEYADMDLEVGDGDTLAVFTAVSGG